MKLKALLFAVYFLLTFLTFPASTFSQTSYRAAGSVAGNGQPQSPLNRPPNLNSSGGESLAKKAKISAATVADLEKKAFQLINQKRAEIGLGPLVWNETVAKIARLHSENMAQFKFFSHTGRDGSTVSDRADSLGISRWRAIAENIAFNRGYEKPVESAVERWMQSTGHRENLLNGGWQESGLGIAVTEDGAYYFTQVFLSRK
jgi:uncharacterized protein YkwD